ncbi:hypothetical protein [Actinophytocola sp.]|uniref:hypothetical protein n=1 Tax=Actinophytocola sp. TaxID=1872138 RepID=UPI0025BF0771|nr:hypothetical protein [Actinophytocola sp.]
MAKRRQVTRPSRRVRRALASARVLDQVVADQLPLVARLPEASRHRAADFLAELVLLSQAYRHHAAGWITRRELERRGTGTVSRIAVIRRRSSLSSAQFTEQD